MAVQTALRLQPEAGEAHRALATYYYYGFRDYARARSELAIARRTLPNDAEIFLYTGLIDRREGHWDDRTRNMERALELDPRNLFILQQLALTYLAQHRYHRRHPNLRSHADDSAGRPIQPHYSGSRSYWIGRRISSRIRSRLPP